VPQHIATIVAGIDQEPRFIIIISKDRLHSTRREQHQYDERGRNTNVNVKSAAPFETVIEPTLPLPVCENLFKDKERVGSVFVSVLIAAIVLSLTPSTFSRQG
jgi:hypothetical protein